MLTNRTVERLAGGLLAGGFVMTSIYLHPTDEDLARSVQKIPC